MLQVQKEARMGPAKKIKEKERERLSAVEMNRLDCWCN
jgi:hypothetical protein